MENRTRKVLSQFSRQEWRNKAASNAAHFKYSREHILRNYKNLKQPSFNPSSELAEYVFSHASPPLLTAIFPFSHSLGEEVNSRKHLGREKRVEQMPEWYEDEEPKETTAGVPVVEIVEKVSAKEEPVKEVKVVLASKHVKNLELAEEKNLEEQFSKIDLKVEEKLKEEVIEDEYAAPDWDDPADEEYVFDSLDKAKVNDAGKEGKEERKGNESLHGHGSQVASQPGLIGLRNDRPDRNDRNDRTEGLDSSAKIVNGKGQGETVKSPEIKVQTKPPAPVFDLNLLRYHQAIRNPFIQLLMDYGTPVGVNSMTFTHGTKPFEKIWFYKDLDGNVQGPFSTLEMFAWTIRDCFPPDLEISIGTPGFFVPMNIFNECSQFEKEEEETEALTSISDSTFSLYGNKDEPPDVITIDDVRGSALVSNDKTKNQENIERNIIVSPDVINLQVKPEPKPNPERHLPSERPSIEKPDRAQRRFKQSRGKPERYEREDDRADRNKVHTLQEIERIQHNRLGKVSESSPQISSIVVNSNNSATFELKSMLGLISKK